MVFIWGRKGHTEVLGTTTDHVECPSCGHVRQWIVTEFAKKATVYFVPIAKYGSQFVVMCPICSAGLPIGGSQRDAIAVMAGTLTLGELADRAALQS